MDEELMSALSMVRDAMRISAKIEEALDGEDLMIILMALSKITGVMLAEAKGTTSFFESENSSLIWLNTGVSAAYRIHLNLTTPTDGNIH